MLSLIIKKQRGLLLKTDGSRCHANAYCSDRRCCRIKLCGAHAPGIPGTFSLSPQVSDLAMHHGTCVAHVPWRMPASLINVFLWSRWRGRRSWHSRRMRIPQFTYLIRGPLYCRTRQSHLKYIPTLQSTPATSIIFFANASALFYKVHVLWD